MRRLIQWMKNNENSHSSDCEWVRLLEEAKKLGITKEEIRIFLQKKKSEIFGQ